VGPPAHPWLSEARDANTLVVVSNSCGVNKMAVTFRYQEKEAALQLELQVHTL